MKRLLKAKPNVLGEYSEENFGVLAGKAKTNKSSFWKGLQEGGLSPPQPPPCFFRLETPRLMPREMNKNVLSITLWNKK